MKDSPAPTPQDWQLIKQLYERAHSMDASERAVFLDSAEGSDAVHAEVLSLLAEEANQSSPANALLSQPGALSVHELDRTGQRLGSWQIVRSLGSGGMGDVFEATRADGSFEGRAAIKLLKRGMDSVAVLQRFAQERQALARLNHPHIAMLLDAGLSEDGRPYFVMEFVDGVPIDDSASTIGLEARLALFLQLAEAVSYAHRNLLVHRDLKPGNVLVTREGNVKLLDFGIAKAIDPSPTLGTSPTLDMPQLFTPNYASPEQVRGEPVTTATDIYSLGVLLYQLLTGVRPTGRNATTPAEAARSVLEEQPTRPSNLTAQQVLNPRWVETRKRLQGDLDNILLKALEKPAERRYASVEALAQDVRNVLSGHPVSARAASWRYVAGKFLIRHQFGSALVAVGLAGLCALTGVALWQANIADQARTAAQRHLDDVQSLARTMIFEVNDAISSGVTPGRAALVKAAGEYLTRRMDANNLTMAETLDIAQALRRMADIEGNTSMDSLGHSASALQRYEQAITVLERIPENQRTDAQWWFTSAGVRRSQSMLMLKQGDLAASVKSSSTGSTMARKAIDLGYTAPKAHRLVCLLLNKQADALYAMDGTPNLGRLDDALVAVRQSVQCAEGLPASQDDDTINHLLLSSALARLARLETKAGNVEAGVSVARRNHAVTTAMLAREPGNQEVARFASIAGSLLGYNLLHAGHADEGVAILAQGVDAARREMDKDPQDDRTRRDFVSLQWTLGEALINLEQGPRALQLCAQAQTAYRTFTTPDADDPELASLKDGLERCVTASLLLLHKPQDALLVIEASLAHISTRADKAQETSKHNNVESLGLGQLLRARTWQQLGMYAQAVTEGANAIRNMDALLRDDPKNTETRGDNAYVHAQAAALGQLRDVRKSSLQCKWALDAHQTFAQLAEHSQMNLQYQADALRVKAIATRCAALPG